MINQKFTLLGDDLKKLLEKNGYKQSVLYSDSPDRLELRAEDGFENPGPVSEHKESMVKKYFLGDDHDNIRYPTDSMLVRLMLFDRKSPCYAVHLIIKKEWEKCLRKVPKITNFFYPTQKDIDAANKIYYKNKGNIATNILSKIIGEDMVRPELYYNQQGINDLILHMIDKGVHLLPSDSENMEDFDKWHKDHLDDILESSEELRSKYFDLAITWRLKREQIPLEFLKTEDALFFNKNTRNEFLRIFGSDYLNMVQESIRYNYLKRLDQLTDTGISVKEAERRLADQEEDTRGKIESLKSDLNNVFHHASIGEGIAMSSEQVSELDDLRRSLARKAAGIIHPDKLGLHSNFDKLTEKEREVLKEKLQEIYKIHNDELGHNLNTVEGNRRSVEALQRIINEAEVILDYAGLELNPEYVIRGETLSEKTTWLNEEIAVQQHQMDQYYAERITLEQDEEFIGMRSALSQPEKHEQLRKEYNKETKKFCQLAGKLEELLDSRRK